MNLKPWLLIKSGYYIVPKQSLYHFTFSQSASAKAFRPWQSWKAYFVMFFPFQLSGYLSSACLENVSNELISLEALSLSIYDNLSCQISKRGIQNQLYFWPKINRRKLLLFVNRHSAEPSKIGHHFRKESVSKIEVIKTFYWLLN